MTEEMGADADGQQVKPHLVLPKQVWHVRCSWRRRGPGGDGIVGNPKGAMASTLALLEQADTVLLALKF